MVDARFIALDSHSLVLREHLSMEGDTSPIDCGSGLIVVAFVNRSGSNLVCSASSELGLAGEPHILSYELLTDEHALPICDERGITRFDDYVRHLVTNRRGSTGFSTLKASVFQLNNLIESGVWARLRPRPVVLVVRRRDVVRQAVSFCQALQDGAWSSMDAGSQVAELTYEPATILEVCRDFHFAGALLDMVCDLHELDRHDLWFEDFAADVEGLRSKLASIAGVPDRVVQPSLLPVQRQPQGAKSDWEQRLRSAHRMPS